MKYVQVVEARLVSLFHWMCFWRSSICRGSEKGQSLQLSGAISSSSNSYVIRLQFFQREADALDVIQCMPDTKNSSMSLRARSEAHQRKNHGGGSAHTHIKWVRGSHGGVVFVQHANYC